MTTKVTEITNTCFACPAQWEGKTDDNRFIYVRYRWGYLDICVSPPDAVSIDDAVMGEQIFGKTIGPEGWGGFMNYDELKEHAAGVIEFPETES